MTYNEFGGTLNVAQSNPMMAVISSTLFFSGWCDVPFIWNKQKRQSRCYTSTEEICRDRTKAMLDRRGQGPGPVLRLMVDTVIRSPCSHFGFMCHWHARVKEKQKS